MDLKNFEEKTLNRKKIFKGHIIEVVHDDVELPNGLGQAKRELVFHPGGVAVLAITPEDKVILISQYRKPMEKVLLEIPAGKLEAGEREHLKEAALRELEEETGYFAQSIELISEVYTSPGFADELLHIFIAKDLVKQANPLPQDDDEVIVKQELTFEEAQAKLQNGEIEDAKTVIALLYWENKRLKGEM
ncbi:MULTISPECIES: NUDIX hydrolase [unclassified Enterococcus]|uniref:NUDIX hydrolase n=1 Tax=unclassified Enterococcus TaxID=2608891 RepID=UPI001556F48F|nr:MULTISPECIES: NUDIX hydrolase [unclassified Enterococcus]MBS7576823.1 NUDIX hydrolase [Enterococcus sp. MMGLQ5-2]MBS7584230.1 NUDIX hydrolase [Enterococcus sp. MMGLQ5-1]NPD12086.1 NUDIX hydrolase [Enterococcus sp. MMGLQ5-1]NPD36658.1 NUDIX hydrolase [Enterococcus sp. MMGLQ5-2]